MNSGHKANLFVVSAPSGAGKTSLVRALVKLLPEIKISISHTTRPLRPGEQEGVDYFFIDEQRFQQMITAEAFLEYATVYDYHYGTSKAWVLEQLKLGNDVLLEIDWQGARQIKKLFPPALLIFIVPPSPEILRQRLQKRQQDKHEVIQRRLAFARGEMAHCVEFDYLVVNDDFNQAVEDLVHVVSAERLQRDVQELKLADLLAELLEKL